MSTRRLVAESAQRLLADLCTPALLRAVDAVHRQGGAPAGLGEATALWQAIQDAGLDLACAPPAQGGTGLGWRDLVEVLVACGRAGAPVPLVETLLAHGLARLADVSLPEGSASLGVALATGTGNTVVADGVAFAGAVRSVLVSVPEAPSGQHRLMVMPGDAGRAESTIDAAGQTRSRLVWPASAVEAHGLLPHGVSVLLAGAAGRVAQIAGACGTALDMATRYAGDRVQFGRPIAKFQAVQQQLAIAGEWTAMVRMAAQLAFSDAGVALDPERVAAAKQVAGTAAEKVAAVAHAVHGAIGITAEYDLQLYTRRLLAWAREFGSSTYWARVLGGELLTSPAPRSWEHVIAVSTAPAD